MKTAAFLLIFLILLGACSSSKKTTETKKTPPHKTSKFDAIRGGSSFDNAIVMKVQNESAGVEEEYKWLAENYPGYSTIRKTQASRIKKHYDIITIRTRDGEERSVYFDSTSFFGKQ